MGAPLPRKERRRQLAREEILVAAREVILSEGLTGFTLTAVAKRLQLTKPALYYYFASKRALVFELVYHSLDAHARAVEAAVEPTTRGEDALAALIRATADHFAGRLDEVRLCYMVPQVGRGTVRFDPEMLARLRPINDRTFGGVAAKIAADQRAGKARASLDGRRLAFVAFGAVLGVLVMEGLVEAADEAPLIHARDAMIDDLVTTFTARLAPSG